MLKTSLHERHEQLNAKMGPFAGFDMPIQYSSVKEEALAVRNSVGVFDVSHMGEFVCTGEGAETFVDSILCNDFASTPVGKAMYSPLCNQQGGILDDLIAYKLAADRVLLCVNAGNIAKDWEWISQQASNSATELPVELVDISDTTDLLALQGSKAPSRLMEVLALDTSELPTFGVVETKTDLGDVIVARTGYTGEDGFEIFAEGETIANLWDKLLATGVTPCGLAARDILRIEVGYPLYGNELTEQLTPLDVGLSWTVKLGRQTTFVGEEFLSDYKPVMRSVKLMLDKGIPRSGYPIANSHGKIIGKVTSGTMSVALNKGICMGLVEIKHFPSDEKFFINIRDRVYPATYSKRAFLQVGK